MKPFLLVLISISIIACSENEGPELLFIDCEQLSGKYKDYGGEEIDCQFYFELTEYNNQKYIELRAHCADLTRPVVINENCEDLCETDPYDENSECGQYLKNREVLEILFIEI